MTRTSQCLAVSLMIHILAAALAGHCTISPVVRRRILPPVERIGDHGDKFPADVLLMTFPKRRIALEVAGSQIQVLEPIAISLPQQLAYSRAEHGEMANAWLEKEAFLPVLSVAQLQTPYESMPSSMHSYPKAEIGVRSAGKHSRTVYIGPGYCVNCYSDALEQMVRDFFAAMMDGDYGKASAISGPRYSEAHLGRSCYADVAEIVSIGKPYLLFGMGPRAGILIYCTVKLSSGQFIGRGIEVIMPWYNSEKG